MHRLTPRSAGNESRPVRYTFSTFSSWISGPVPSGRGVMRGSCPLHLLDWRRRPYRLRPGPCRAQVTLSMYQRSEMRCCSGVHTKLVADQFAQFERRAFSLQRALHLVDRDRDAQPNLRIGEGNRTARAGVAESRFTRSRRAVLAHRFAAVEEPDALADRHENDAVRSVHLDGAHQLDALRRD